MHAGTSRSVLVSVIVILLATVADAQFTTVINSPPTEIANDEGVSSNTQVNISANGVVGISFGAGAADGTSENVQVNISGGTVGDRFEAFRGSTVNISGGVVGPFFDANAGSTVTISGGVIEHGFDAFAESLVNLSGGAVGDDFEAASGSAVNVSGGLIGDRFSTRSNSSVTLEGGEFRLDNEPVGELGPMDVPTGATLSGTFADGTPFAFSSDDGDALASGSITLRSENLPAVGPALITASNDPVPQGVRGGQELSLIHI